MDEDKLFVSTWLNVSKHTIVGVNQKGDGFWLRIKIYIIMKIVLTRMREENRCTKFSLDKDE